MSAPTLALRPAIDARPPALSWSAGLVVAEPASPDQPQLQLVLERGEEIGSPVVAPARARVAVDTAPAGVDSAHAGELAEQARTWAPWFAQLLVEALEGRRPLEALGHWLDEWVLAEVGRRVRVQRRTRLRSPAPGPQPPGRIVSLRTQFSHPRVLEVALHLRRGRRSHALAFQLQRFADRWRCTALELRE
jgi:hypothetical protein